MFNGWFCWFRKIQLQNPLSTEFRLLLNLLIWYEKPISNIFVVECVVSLYIFCILLNGKLACLKIEKFVLEIFLHNETRSVSSETDTYKGNVETYSPVEFKSLYFFNLFKNGVPMTRLLLLYSLFMLTDMIAKKNAYSVMLSSWQNVLIFWHKESSRLYSNLLAE